MTSPRWSCPWRPIGGTSLAATTKSPALAWRRGVRERTRSVPGVSLRSESVLLEFRNPQLPTLTIHPSSSSVWWWVGACVRRHVSFAHGPGPVDLSMT